MSARLCIGGRCGDAIFELPLDAVEVLLDFVSEQEDHDGVGYRDRMRPLREAIGVTPADPDDFDPRAMAEGFSTTAASSALHLATTLLNKYGAAWGTDPDWKAAHLSPRELSGLLEYGQEDLRRTELEELVSWIVY